MNETLTIGSRSSLNYTGKFNLSLSPITTGEAIRKWVFIEEFLSTFLHKKRSLILDFHFKEEENNQSSNDAQEILLNGSIPPIYSMDPTILNLKQCQ